MMMKDEPLTQDNSGEVLESKYFFEDHLSLEGSRTVRAYIALTKEIICKNDMFTKNKFY